MGGQGLPDRKLGTMHAFHKTQKVLAMFRQRTAPMTRQMIDKRAGDQSQVRVQVNSLATNILRTPGFTTLLVHCCTCEAELGLETKPANPPFHPQIPIDRSGRSPLSGRDVGGWRVMLAAWDPQSPCLTGRKGHFRHLTCRLLLLGDTISHDQSRYDTRVRGCEASATNFED
jgi:hypothetical protein